MATLCLRRRQCGQLPSRRVRLWTVVSHSCPETQRHQTRREVPEVTSLGLSVPFLVGCHCRATLGKQVASALVFETRRPLQNGQLSAPRLDRLATVVCHSWSSPLGHFHHTRRIEAGSTSPG